MKALITRRQALAASSALALAPFDATAAERETVGMQLILAADVSGSVNAARYKTQQEGYLEALGDPRVLDVIRELEPPVLAVTFIAWARDQEVMGALFLDARRRLMGEREIYRGTLDRAVVEPEAMEALVSFDPTVRHYEVIEEAAVRRRK